MWTDLLIDGLTSAGLAVDGWEGVVCKTWEIIYCQHLPFICIALIISQRIDGWKDYNDKQTDRQTDRQINRIDRQMLDGRIDILCISR